MICLACGAQLDTEAEVCSQCSAPTSKKAEASVVESQGVSSLLRPGQRLADRYLIKRSLGVGRLGVTYHVTDLDTGREVALKMVFRHLLFSKRDRDRFQLWMESTRSLTSARLAAPQRSGRDEHIGSFVVTELVDAPSLASVQKTRGKPPRVHDVAELVAQLRIALDTLPNERPHGGLHPGNILLCPDRVVLTDLCTYEGMLPQLWSEAQRQGFGGASWLAPEVIQGREDLDRRADVYSIAGLVMWLLSGLEPGAKALSAVREQFPAIAGVLRAAHTDLASERLFEVMPIEAALREAARLAGVQAESSDEYIALDAADVIDDELPDEVTEITSSEELSIREEDVLGIQNLIEEPTPIHTSPPKDLQPKKPVEPKRPTIKPAAVASESTTAKPTETRPEGAPKPLRARPAPRRVQGFSNPEQPALRRSRMPRWFVFAAFASLACAITFVAAKKLMPQAVVSPVKPAAKMVPVEQSLNLDDDVDEVVVAGSAESTAEGRSPADKSDEDLAARRLAAFQKAKPDSGVGLDVVGAEEVTQRRADETDKGGEVEEKVQAKAPAADAPDELDTEPSATDESIAEDEQPVAVEPVAVEPAAVEPVVRNPEPEPEPIKVSRPEPVVPKGRASCRKGMGLVRVGAVVSCVDRYEYPNYLRSPPQGNFNAYKAQALCKKKGKRICTEREWVAACSGAQGSSFPYGGRFVAGRCNTLEDGRDDAVAPLEYKKCRSSSRIYAMAGNLAEWTKDGSGFALKGGSYAHGGSQSRCRGRLQASPRVAQPEFGVRCCADPTYK